jgi:transcriptional regulator with XRE-family HTH domain
VSIPFFTFFKFFSGVFFMATFADRLKELRKARGLSQKALAQSVGMSDTGIQNYELETRTPNADVVIKLSDFFGVSADYLLGRTNYSVDGEGNIKVKTPPDIFNVDAGELRGAAEGKSIERASPRGLDKTVPASNGSGTPLPIWQAILVLPHNHSCRLLGVPPKPSQPIHFWLGR